MNKEKRAKLIEFLKKFNLEYKIVKYGQVVVFIDGISEKNLTNLKKYQFFLCVDTITGTFEDTKRNVIKFYEIQ